MRKFLCSYYPVKPYASFLCVEISDDMGEDAVLWPNPESAELGNKEISFDEALILRGLKKE